MLGNIVLELQKIGCVICGSEIENRMLKPYYGCYELLVQFLFVEGASLFIHGFGSLGPDMIFFHLHLGGRPDNYRTSGIGAF